MIKNITLNYEEFHSDFIRTDSENCAVILGCATDLLLALKTVNMTERDREICKSLQRGYIVRDRGANSVSWYEHPPIKKKELGIYVEGMYSSIRKLQNVFPNCSFDFVRWDDDMIFNIEDYLRIYENRVRR